MAALHRALALLSIVILCSLLAGLVRRRKSSQCATFTVYIACVTVFTLLIQAFPSHYSPEAFTIKQAIYDCLLFGMALELSYRAFAAFKGIATQIRAWLALAVALSSVAIFWLTPPDPDYAHLSQYQPAITTAGIWCLSFVAFLIVWYQIPVPAFTRSLFLAYVPYLLVFVTYIDLIGRLGWGEIQHLNVANAAAYDLAIGYLAFAAWRKD